MLANPSAYAPVAPRCRPLTAPLAREFRKATAARNRRCVRTHASGNQQQQNPNNDAFWRTRGWSERPADWRERWLREKQQRNSPAGQASTQNREGQRNRNHVNYWLARGYDFATAKRFASQGCDDDGYYYNDD